MAKYENEITLLAVMDNMDTALGKVEDWLKEAGCSTKVIMQIIVCVEEIFVNIANYAYQNSQGCCTIRFKANDLSDGMAESIITVMDNGIRFDPLGRDDPDITLSADERDIGGLGIFMVKKTMDKVEYEYENETNILTMSKTWKKCLL